MLFGMSLTERVVQLINQKVERLLGLADDQLLQEREEKLSDLMLFQVCLDLLRLFKFLNSIHF